MNEDRDPLRSALQEKLHDHEMEGEDLNWDDMERLMDPPAAVRLRSLYRMAAAAAVLLLVAAAGWIFYLDGSSGNATRSTLQEGTAREEGARPPSQQNEQMFVPDARSGEREQMAAGGVADTLPDGREMAAAQQKDTGAKTPDRSPLTHEAIGTWESAGREGWSKAAKRLPVFYLTLDDLPGHVDLRSTVAGRKDRLTDRSRAAITGRERRDVNFSGSSRASSRDLQLSSLSVGVSPMMEYNWLRPSTSDIYYIDRINTPSSMNPRRLGAHSRVSAEFSWLKGTKLYVGGSLIYQRRHIRFRISNLLDGYTTQQTRSLEEWYLGGHVGIKYAWRTTPGHASYLWLGLEYGYRLKSREVGQQGMSSLVLGYEWRYSVGDFVDFGIAPTLTWGLKGGGLHTLTRTPYRLGLNFTVYRSLK